MSTSHIIGCSAPVFIPDGWSILPESEQIRSRVVDQFNWDPTKVILHLDEGQKGGKCIAGRELRKKLEGQSVLTAHVLDYLLKKENWYLIPEEWKSKAVFFWGTIYCNANGNSCVRSLDWSGVGWDWGYYSLGSVFDGYDPSVCAQ